MAKICFIASSLFTMGGEQRVTAVIANELVKNNQIIAYTMDEEPDKLIHIRWIHVLKFEKSGSLNFHWQAE